MLGVPSTLAALLIFSGCSSGGAPAAPLPDANPHAPSGPDTLVIPANEPSWDQLHGLLDNPGQYGEASWDDVRMRVIGHVATIGRDRARASAMRQDWAGCAAAYRDTAARILAIPSASETGAPIRKALSDAATRDAAFCDALAAGAAPQDPGVGIAHLRAVWQGLALRAAAGGNVAAEARALAVDARAFPVPSLVIDDFADFKARHVLRVKLVQAYADAVNPLRVEEPWGYWDASEIGRIAQKIAVGAEVLVAMSEGRAVPGPSAVELPSPLSFSAESLGALPTGDSLVDTVGFPGPKAIGSLAVLSLEDAEHRAWLERQAATLNAAPSAQVPALIAEMVTALDARPYGSRYYNIKAARNAAVRVLASRRAYAEARTVLLTSWPLHAQDWACPDRAAILTAIEGRLLLAAGSEEAAGILDQAMAEADAFLAHVAAREASGPSGGPSGGPMGPPGGGGPPGSGGPAGPPGGPPR